MTNRVPERRSTSLRLALAFVLLPWFLLAFLLAAAPTFVLAQTSDPEKGKADKADKADKTDKAVAADKAEETAPPSSPETPPVTTEHQVVVSGKTLRYTATAGYLPMKDEEGKLKANVFFIAYTRGDVEDQKQRPITFTFNGGPGSSSVWLHLGALGPQRVLMDDEGFPLPPPFRMAPNEGTWLEFTDLVFIDPVLTGYSRPAPGEDKAQFHGVEEDVQSVGDFIRLYTTRYRRWSSPKFIAGESYGTTRAAGLSGYLQLRHGMYLNGIVLISSVLEFSTVEFDRGNDLPYVLYLPSYTATAWYHKKLLSDLQQAPLQAAIQSAREFAREDYARALLLGAALAPSTRAEVVRRLARLTGLGESYLEQNNLRVPLGRFLRELLRADGLIAGRLDSRFTGSAYDDAGETFEYDPSMSAIRGPYTQALNAYVREELGYENDLVYEILGPRVQPWNWGTDGREGYTNVAETLRQGMTENPSLHVLVANGYYDMATPFFATEHTFNHLGGDPALLERVTMTYFEAGHMMYIRRASLLKLRDDARAFAERSLGR